MKQLIIGILAVVFTISCGRKGGSSPVVDAAKLYKVNCMLCHGTDGKLGANGSKDLTQSKLSVEDRVAIITNGKGAMTPFKGILSDDEIKAVAAYTFQLH